ncbi:MAG: SIR2 family protein [Planctomycetota bacterium]|nr:SIR2 family protein [Planctomycetota bacterium]
MTISEQDLIDAYSKRLAARQATLFVGAGLSMASGFVDWKGLLAGPARQIGVKLAAIPDLTELAEYYAQEVSRESLIQTVVDTLAREAELTENHQIIAGLPVHEIWTTNYDDLLERAFKMAGGTVEVRRRDNDFLVGRPDASVYIHKMHGDLEDRQHIVITRSDYERYGKNCLLMQTSFLKALADTTFLFLGVGFADPNFLNIMGSLFSHMDGKLRPHYAIMLRPKPKDHRRFDLFVRNLRRYGIQTVIADAPQDVTRILRAISAEIPVPSEVLIGQRVRNQFIVKNLGLLSALPAEKQNTIRFCSVFSAFAISRDPDYVAHEPDKSPEHMDAIMRERQLLEFLVNERKAPLRLLLCPPKRFCPEHEVRYRTILQWLKDNEHRKNVEVRCATLDFFTNLLIIENYFCIAANYSQTYGYDENRLYRDRSEIERRIREFDSRYENADLARSTTEAVNYYESTLSEYLARKAKQWTRSRTEVRYSWGGFQVVTDSASAEDRGDLTYTYLQHPGSVLVVPVLRNGNLLLVEQYRYLTGDRSIEFPAGRVEVDEARVDTAQRELREETAHRSDKWRPLGEFYASNSVTNEVVEVFLATEVEPCDRALDARADGPVEIDSVREYSIDDLRGMITSGVIKDGPTIAALQYLTEQLLAR